LELGETKAKVPIYLTWRRSPKERRRRTRRRPHHRVARATPGTATWWCGPPVHPLTLPFRLEIPILGKTLMYRTLFHETYCKPPLSSSRDREGPEAFPGNLPKRGIITGGLIHHLASFRSDAWVVYLGYGSIAVARWMSSPPCASCLDLVSCLSWLRSLLCNSTSCVCWGPMNIEYYVKLIVDLSCLCYLWFCMLSVASRYLGRVDASDSKREYLCSIVGSCL
jgi:hypothetical protein